MSAAKITAIIAYGHHLALTGQTEDERMHNWGPSVTLGIDMLNIMVDALQHSETA